MFSCFIYFLCTLFSEFAEIYQPPYCINSLNEWVPWSRDTIQGSHYNLSFAEILFNNFKLLFDLRNSCEVRLYSLRVLYLHILQLVPQSHILIDALLESSLIESTKILLALSMLLLWAALSSYPFGFGTSPLMYWSKSFSSRIKEIIYFHPLQYFP